MQTPAPATGISPYGCQCAGRERPQVFPPQRHDHRGTCPCRPAARNRPRRRGPRAETSRAAYLVTRAPGGLAEAVSSVTAQGDGPKILNHAGAKAVVHRHPATICLPLRHADVIPVVAPDVTAPPHVPDPGSPVPARDPPGNLQRSGPHGRRVGTRGTVSGPDRDIHSATDLRSGR